MVTPRKELLGQEAPKASCTDRKCPYHGQLTVAPEVLTGTVIKKDVNRSATIEWNRAKYISKYERYQLRRSRLRVHNPGCINARVGDAVIVARSRPLSKTKHHVILKVTGHRSVAEAQLAQEQAQQRQLRQEHIKGHTGEEA